MLLKKYCQMTKLYIVNRLAVVKFIWNCNLNFRCSLLTILPLQILPVNIKGLAGSVATLGNWLASWAITMTANLLLSWSSGGWSLSPSVCVFGHEHVHAGTFNVCARMCCVHSNLISYNSPSPGTFTIYAVVCAFSLVFVILWVPETKGRSLEEIQWSFRWIL